MLIKTHLAITLCFVLLFLSFVENKLVFVLVALIATFIPDVDSRYSTVGRRKLARIFQFFTKHRGITHSFIFLLTITFILVLFFPTIALGFFLGYGLHLLADSFTMEGILPLYPLRKKSSGYIRTGGKSEVVVLVVFVILDIFLLSFEIFINKLLILK